MTHLDSVMNKLKDGQITADELQFVFKLLGHWPNDKCFPREYNLSFPPNLHG
jgi:hypothetical protein